jgi:hypothetical protein
MRRSWLRFPQVSKTFFVNIDAWKASTRYIRGPDGIFESLMASETWNLFEFLRDTQQLSATGIAGRGNEHRRLWVPIHSWISSSRDLGVKLSKSFVRAGYTANRIAII